MKILSYNFVQFRPEYPVPLMISHSISLKRILPHCCNLLTTISQRGMTSLWWYHTTVSRFIRWSTDRLIILSCWFSSDEVLTAAAAAAAEGKEVGERRLLDRRDAEGWGASSVDVDGVQELVGGVSAESDLSFVVDGAVRLDAGVPARLDASAGRLLEPSVVGASRARFHRCYLTNST